MSETELITRLEILVFSLKNHPHLTFEREGFMIRVTDAAGRTERASYAKVTQGRYAHLESLE